MAICALQPLVSLPWDPTLTEFVRWLRGIGYPEDYLSSLLASDLTAEQVLGSPSSKLKNALALPTLGAALDLQWEISMSDVRCQRMQAMDGGRTSLSCMRTWEVVEWFESLGAARVAALFLHHDVTGKGVEICNSCDLQAMGMVEPHDVLQVYKARKSGLTPRLSISSPLAVDGGSLDPLPYSSLDSRCRSVYVDEPGPLFYPLRRQRERPWKNEYSQLLHAVRQVREMGWTPSKPAAISAKEQARLESPLLISVPDDSDEDLDSWSASSCTALSASSHAVAEREVRVVGILGPSGAGKSSLSRRLAVRMASPYEPLQTDWYVRRVADLPSCPHVSRDRHVRWNRRTCYELPAAYDLQTLRDDLLRLVEHARYCDSDNFHPFFVHPPAERRHRMLGRGVAVEKVVPFTCLWKDSSSLRRPA